MGTLLECPNCKKGKFFLTDLTVLTSMPPIYVNTYKCAHCGQEVIVETRDRVRKAEFVHLTDDSKVFM